MKKYIATLTACCISTATLLSVGALSAQAVDDNTYTFSIVPETTVISAESLAEGDVIVHSKIYIDGNPDGKFASSFVRFQSDSSQMYFRNITSCDTKTDEEQTYTYSGGSFTTSYLPYCFGTVNSKGRYSTNSFIHSESDYAVDSKFGSYLYSDGKGGVYFTITYYTAYQKDENGELVLDKDGRPIRIGKTTETIYCDVEVDETGTGHYSFEYLDQTYFTKQTATVTIPNYEADLPEGEKIPGTNNTMTWYSGNVMNGSGFLGNPNEFPYAEVDVIVKQGTPNGVYTLSFDDSYCRLNDEDSNRYKLNFESAQILVGEPTIAVSEASLPEYLCYAADDITPIHPADCYTQRENTKITANFTYADGTTETKDITEQIHGDGRSASQLFAAQSSAYMTAEMPLYYGNQQLISAETGEPITQKVLIGKKGDVDFDGEVTLTDATIALTYYAEHAVGNRYYFTTQSNQTPSDPMLETLAYFLADIDTDSQNVGEDGGSVDLSDATMILTYYAEHAVSNSVYWDDLLK